MSHVIYCTTDVTVNSGEEVVSEVQWSPVF